MKQVPALLTGSIFIVLTLCSAIVSADSLNDYSIDFDLLAINDYDQIASPNSLFEEFRIESSFLFSHSIANNYTVGLNYTDLIFSDNQRASRSNSNLLVMLELKF